MSFLTPLASPIINYLGGKRRLLPKILPLVPLDFETYYEPFVGSGTTAVACQRLNLSFVGSEISMNQVEWSKNRLLEDSPKTSLDIFLE